MNVVITGATKGIGRAVAEKFAEAGYNLVACARTKEDVEKLQRDFSERFPAISVATKAVDLGNGDEVKEFAKWILEKPFTPDILVNNAGYFTPGSIHSEDEETFHRMMHVNLYSAYHLTRSLLPAMMERRRGHIFNICSIASVKPMANVGSYGISKFALYGFSKHLREEMKPYGIKVTAVLPGSTYTSSWEGSGVEPDRLIAAGDIAKMVFACAQLSPTAVVEDLIVQPQLGSI